MADNLIIANSLKLLKMFAFNVLKLSGHKAVVSLSFLFLFTFLVGICSAKTMATSNSVEKINNGNELEPRLLAQYRSSDSAPVGFIPSLGAGPFYDEVTTFLL